MGLLLNNQWLDLSAADGRQPLLNWLRDKQHLCATKEGCGAGDCGACTVLVGRRQEQRMHYQAINACIALLGSFSGCHVVTLEGLSVQAVLLQDKGHDSATTATPLHPVQQALVDYHSSQCGFCTPGIVMATVAWWLNTPANTLQTEAQRAHHRHELSEALSGNLCRCTGYQPIFNASDALAPSCLGGNLNTISVAGLSQQDIIQQLSAYSQSVQTSQSSTPPSELNEHAQTTQHYWLPVNDEQWLQTVAAVPINMQGTQESTVQFVAGSTDLGVAITQQQIVPTTLINVTQLPGFKDLHEVNNQLHIGASVTFSELAAFLSQTSLQPLFKPPFKQESQYNMQQAWLKLLPLIGSRQVRNEGTIGGNIANGSPIADTPPLLLVLEANLVLQQGTQTRTLPLSEFYLGYKQTQLKQGELIKTIIIDLPSPLTKVYVEKISKRKEDDISAVCLAMAIQCDDQHKPLVKIGLGGVAATPVYAHAAAAYISENTRHGITEQQLLSLLTQDISPLSDARASADYRLHTCAKILHYWCQQCSATSATQGGV